MTRQYNVIDQFIIAADGAISGFFKPAVATSRPYPAEDIDEGVYASVQKQDSAGLMRVNHAGEISAQALYKAQAVTARDESIKESMQQAANEEIDHLYWCRRRLAELDSHPSVLDPFWFTGSFMIGLVAGSLGDKWNLGFLAETERQVVKHLQSHLDRLPESDQRSRVILEQMKVDEAEHASTAVHAGANELPMPIKIMMRYGSRVMTAVAYRI